MNKSQWFVLSWSCMIIGVIFIAIDSFSTRCINLISEQLSIYDVWCVVNAEIYEPFIYMFYMLFIVFMILGFMEKKK